MANTLVVETKNENEFLKDVRARLVARSFFGFCGEMGAGKTTFISRLLSDSSVIVSSPTFALYNTYQLANLDVVHVDLYRLKTEEEIDSSGFWDLFSNLNSVILTEWVERLKSSDIPLNWTQWMVKIDVGSDQVRSYSLFRVTP